MKELITLTREEAIKSIASAELALLSSEERIEQLWVMSEAEDWSEAVGWSSLDASLQQEFEGGPLAHDAGNERYDPILLIWLRKSYSAATNEFLGSRLETLGLPRAEVSGETEPMEACPCCGARSIAGRGEYDICRVCWWEDDGSDNDTADQISGPNHVSLVRARANVLLQGIYDPARADLRDLLHPSGRYERGRTFELTEDGQWIREVGVSWVARVSVVA